MIEHDHLDRIQDMLRGALSGRSWEEIRRCIAEVAHLAQAHGQLELCLRAQSVGQSLVKLPDACPLGAEFPWASEIAERLNHLQWLASSTQAH